MCRWRKIWKMASHSRSCPRRWQRVWWSLTLITDRWYALWCRCSITKEEHTYTHRTQFQPFSRTSSSKKDCRTWGIREFSKSHTSSWIQIGLKPSSKSSRPKRQRQRGDLFWRRTIHISMCRWWSKWARAASYSSTKICASGLETIIRLTQNTSMATWFLYWASWDSIKCSRQVSGIRALDSLPGKA